MLCAGAVIGQHNDRRALLGIVLVLVLVPIALIDLEHTPDSRPDHRRPPAILALVIGTALDPSGEVERLIAGVAAGGFLFIAWLAYPGGMGFGDVKLAAVLGLFLGAFRRPGDARRARRRRRRRNRDHAIASASKQAARRRSRSARSSPSAASSASSPATRSSRRTSRASARNLRLRPASSAGLSSVVPRRIERVSRPPW